MMIVPMSSLATAAAGAAVIALSGASISNMYEMFTLARHHNKNSSPVASDQIRRAANWRSIDEAINELQTMKRKDLISLYLDCEHPDVNDLAVTCCRETNHGTMDDDWVYDGYLLSNGPILTAITNFITNVMFGRGFNWLGKVYFSSNHSECVGKNRFRQKQKGEVERKTTEATEVLLDRTFDYYIGQSALCSSPSLINRYSFHCSRWSLMSLFWRGMVDELRVIPLSFNAVRNDGQIQPQCLLLLGMGYFTWSGGAWNSAPFCLVARTVK